MAEPRKWEEADLLALVANQVSEGAELDFKACAALQRTEGKKNELSRDVSAFANSAGGTLVYGIVEDETTHTAAKLDEGFDPSVISKEWIEQVINSKIHPRIQGVRIKAIELHTHNPGRVAYVVTVPQGATAHQAADRRYNRRYNFESVPMEDYEIRDVMNRAEAPVLDLEFLVGEHREEYVQFMQQENRLCSPEIAVWLVNSSDSTPAEYCQCQVFLPAYLSVKANANFVSSGSPVFLPMSFFPSKSSLTFDSALRVGLGYWEVRLGPDLGPTFPGERRALATLSFCNESRLTASGNIYVIWRVRAARARPRTGCVVFAKQGDRWYFQAASIESLEDTGVAVSLAP